MYPSRRSFNCLGYALNVRKRLEPPDNDKYEKVSNFIKWLCRTHNVSVVDMGNENWLTDGKEYAIFRSGADDFHFVKKTKRGYFYEKVGYSQVLRRVTKSYALGSEPWVNCCDKSLIYDSTPILLRVKET